MEKEKKSLADIKEKLTRKEMKSVMAGITNPTGFCGAASWACARLGMYSYTGDPNKCCTSMGSGGSW